MQLTLLLLLSFSAMAATPVADEMNAPAYHHEFATKVCGLKLRKGKQPGNPKKAEECSARWWTSFNARLTETYPLADGASIGRHCTARPLECTPERIEQWAQESQAQGAEVRKAESLNAFGKALQGIVPVKKEYNCHTSRDGIGGFNTTCD
jgi:hypothetical protein